ncbi:MAG: MFS transporter [Acidimicrobiales bacterium]
MTRHHSRHQLTATELEARRQPRTDVLVERADGPDRFVQHTGPFSRYERVLEVTPNADAGFDVTERFDWKLAIPVWSVLFRRPVRRSLINPPRPGTVPAWSPPDMLDIRTTRIFSLLAVLAVFDGYLGAILSQTMTFAADEFGNSTQDQSTALAAVRSGVLISIVLLTLADRQGRRALLLITGMLACGLTIVGGLAPNLWVLGATQAGARGVTTALGILILVVMAEELPAGSRAYGTSVLALAAALGAGVTIWLLPLADLGEAAWRIHYFVPLLFFAPIWWAARQIPESKRFLIADEDDDPAPDPTLGRRLLLLGVTSFFLAFFAAPASQLRNDYLKNERGMTGSDIALFSLVTYAPWGLGVFLAGRIADIRGRRPVAILGLLGGALFTVLGYSSAGVMLWVFTLVGNFIGAATVPSLGVYGPEMFSTRRRGQANATITLIAVGGSTLGLLLVGSLADDSGLGNYGQAFLIASVAAVIAAVLIAVAYPETARRELEDINPTDEHGAGRRTG